MKATMMKSPGHLYLIPLPIVVGTHTEVIPSQVGEVVKQLNYFLVEDLRTARRYVKALGHPQPIAALQFVGVNKHTTPDQVADYMQPVLKGQDAGVMAEVGCPGVADPGAMAVQYAHQHNIEVVPLTGPSSILLALMASGMNGQSFAFHGYLPVEKSQRKAAIKQLDRIAWQCQQTQIFIETPYRNQALLEAILATCRPETLLCIGKQMTAPEGWVQTRPLHQWRQSPPWLHKIPAIFLLNSAPQG